MGVCIKCRKELGMFGKKYFVDDKRVCDVCYKLFTYGKDYSEAEYRLFNKIVEFLLDYFSEEQARKLLVEEMTILDVQHFTTIGEEKLSSFIKTLVGDSFLNIASPSRRKVIRTKFLSWLELPAEKEFI